MVRVQYEHRQKDEVLARELAAVKHSQITVVRQGVDAGTRRALITFTRWYVRWWIMLVVGMQ